MTEQFDALVIGAGQAGPALAGKMLMGRVGHARSVPMHPTVAQWLPTQTEALAPLA